MRKLTILAVTLLIAIAVDAGLSADHGAAENSDMSTVLLIKRQTEAQLDAQYAAKAWSTEYLSKDMAPPENVNYILTNRGNGQPCDLARISYKAGKSTIVVTQSRFFFAIQVFPDAATIQDEPLKLDEVQKFAERLFIGGNALRLTTDKTGLAGTSMREGVDEYPWLRAVQWRSEKDGVSFWLVKQRKTPGSAVLFGDVKGNARWFSEPDPLPKR